MRIDIYLHHVGADSKLDEILEKVNTIMAAVDDLRAELVEINTTTNELAVDVDDLLARLSGGLSAAEAEEVKTKLQELKAALQAVAVKHTPATP